MLTWYQGITTPVRAFPNLVPIHVRTTSKKEHNTKTRQRPHLTSQKQVLWYTCGMECHPHLLTKQSENTKCQAHAVLIIFCDKLSATVLQGSTREGRRLSFSAAHSGSRDEIGATYPTPWSSLRNTISSNGTHTRDTQIMSVKSSASFGLMMS